MSFIADKYVLQYSKDKEKVEKYLSKLDFLHKSLLALITASVEVNKLILLQEVYCIYVIKIHITHSFIYLVNIYDWK